MKNDWFRAFKSFTAFAVGCLAVAVPFFIRASVIHADETARHEQTMASGITMFVGMICAPFGGAAAVIIWKWVDRRRNSQSITTACQCRGYQR